MRLPMNWRQMMPAAVNGAICHDCFLISNEVNSSLGFLKPAGEEIGLAFIRRIFDNSSHLMGMG